MDIKGGKQYLASELQALIKSQPVRLYPTLKSKIFLFSIAVGFVALGAGLIFWGKAENDIVMVIIGALSVIFFGPIGLLMIKKFTSGRPTLEISRDGFYDYHNLKGQLVTWEEVSDIVTYTINSNTFLGIALKDPDTTLKNLSRLKLLGINSNQKLGLPELPYPQTLLGGQKAQDVAESMAIFIK